ncbi:sulfatase-like hydrolase/transferase [Flavobacterium ginsengisoli]|uniref:sulfatase-like hydrolase/transferase n=1 Tax=Flavobacterium ginsengisoli TaxID=871694 RepID=UPI003BF5D0F1
MKEYYSLKQIINLKFNCSFQNNIGSIFLLVALILSSTIKIYAQDVLPFPPVPSASVANETLAESTHKRRAQPDHLPKDAPNIIIILMDDLGFGTPSTFGGGVNTPTLTKVFKEGIAYNEFHTTSICSPSRARFINRQKPYARRKRNNCRTSRRLGWLHGNYSQRSDYRCRSLKRLWLQHFCFRKMAQYASKPDNGCGTF